MSPVKKATVSTWNDVMQLNYGVPDINLVSGKGLLVTDSEKKKYLDFLGGIATNILGHAHPAIVLSLIHI